MSGTVLVTYGSTGGSTAEVAQAIGKTLSENGFSVAVRPAQEIASVADYGAVVVGSHIHAGQLHPDVVQFIAAHRAELSRRPFAPFIVSMTMSVRPAMIRGAARKFLTGVRDLVTPISEGYFAGVVNFDVMFPPEVRRNALFRWGQKLGMFSEGDHRDWQAIAKWAHDLGAKLRTTLN